MSQVEPIHRPHLHDVLVERLRDLITEGEITPGEKINEKSLTEAFGVSRTPLREALKVLASEGIVTLTPNRGARVARLSAKDLDDVFPVLMSLEGLAGRLACEKMTDAAIGRVESLQIRMEKEFEAHDRSAYFRTNQEIHEAILEGSENEVLIATHKSLAGRIRRARYLANMSPERWRQAVEEHRAILEALKSRDGVLISELLAAHLSNKLESLRASIRDGSSPVDED